jgi:hypothetical protein
MTRRKSSSCGGSGRANGHANGRANGQAGTNGHAAAIESAVTINTAESDALAAHLHRAGSDDCTADSAAGSASSAGARAGREAYAELAQADPAESAAAEGKWLRPPEAASRTASNANAAGGANGFSEMSSKTTSRSIGGNSGSNGGSSGASSSRASRDEKSESAFRLTPPGTEPLPLDGATFVEAVHERVDLIALEEQLLRSADEKIVQRELAYLRELRYGKTASFATDDDLPPRIVFDPPDPLP